MTTLDPDLTIINDPIAARTAVKSSSYGH